MKTINEPVLILHAEDDHIIPIKCGFKVGHNSPNLYYLPWSEKSCGKLSLCISVRFYIYICLISTFFCKTTRTVWTKLIESSQNHDSFVPFFFVPVRNSSCPSVPIINDGTVPYYFFSTKFSIFTAVWHTNKTNKRLITLIKNYLIMQFNCLWRRNGQHGCLMCRRLWFWSLFRKIKDDNSSICCLCSIHVALRSESKVWLARSPDKC